LKAAPILRALIPYAAILLGLYWLKSGWAALLMYHAGMASWLAAVGPRPGKLSIGSVKAVLLLASAGLAAGPAFVLLWPVSKLPGVGMESLLSGFGLNGWSLAVFALYYSSFHPLLEEAFWRFPPAPAAVGLAEDALFAGYHLLVLLLFLKPPFLPLVFAVLFFSGVAWRKIIRRGGRLEAVVSHAAGDAATMAATILLMGK
jgi:hypothetical protein